MIARLLAARHSYVKGCDVGAASALAAGGGIVVGDVGIEALWDGSRLASGYE